ncbi:MULTISPECIES: EVE domain-containing protein [unclassified Oceanobacter]|jgi:predicted RNA-binding protein with PUA-like domain|uniref:EVE domain-containing protein n=1 Tax=unclassified Oceanobacter TaxID=2620260 RepID=UPI0026E18045|nr:MULTISPECIES: EVE domain-containing protein [unclassified Oceanobacter]MDO6681581.1 EVE domain-containing protein [Oceanobacter sp. 5_MG-2023]MDP2505791.1 EVE domain-containing protein [Oceanobacter sp. 3_MG-2023]MDP2547382.1 EVE domain-containing protein [Oceanobacter sp. 4_MG-2023]
MNYWLFKTEPTAFSIQDLASRPKQTEPWDGVRNYQARNFLRDEIQPGDQVFIYHSSCKEIGIAGLAEVVRAGYVDPSQFDPESRYYDPKATQEKPRWYQVDIQLAQVFPRVLPLQDIKAMPEITELGLIKTGNRLSVMPVSPREFDILRQRAS